jgi:hypothetical protein
VLFFPAWQTTGLRTTYSLVGGMADLLRSSLEAVLADIRMRLPRGSYLPQTLLKRLEHVMDGTIDDASLCLTSFYTRAYCQYYGSLLAQAAAAHVMMYHTYIAFLR